MKKFIENNFTVIVLTLTVLTFFKGCGDTREISKVRKEMVDQEKRYEIKIQIEGLKSEKRALQASDRKILDVQRQTQIDEEIKKLEKTIK